MTATLRGFDRRYIERQPQLTPVPIVCHSAHVGCFAVLLLPSTHRRVASDPSVVCAYDDT